MDELLKYLGALSLDERESFALRCKTSIGYLRKACSVGQRLGEGLCINIERESRKAVMCEALRPDVDWAYLRNSGREQAITEPAPEVAGAIAVVVDAVNTVVQDAREQIHKLEVHAEVEIKHAALDMRAEVATAQQAALAAWDGKERRNLPWSGEEHREGEADRRKYEVLGSPVVAADKLVGQGV